MVDEFRLFTRGGYHRKGGGATRSWGWGLDPVIDAGVIHWPNACHRLGPLMNQPPAPWIRLNRSPS